VAVVEGAQVSAVNGTASVSGGAVVTQAAVNSTTTTLNTTVSVPRTHLPEPV
jgi:hypothetical protein